MSICLIVIFSYLSSHNVISLPPGWQLPYLHPPHFTSCSNAVPFPPVKKYSAVLFCWATFWFQVGIREFQLLLGTLLQWPWWIRQRVFHMLYQKRSGCAPPTIFPNGPSCRTRSPVTFTLLVHSDCSTVQCVSMQIFQAGFWEEHLEQGSPTFFPLKATFTK